MLSQSTQDALANVLVHQLVRLHDPPAAVSPCTAQEPSKGYLLSHTQLSVSNVNFNWGVCEGQEEDDAGRDCGQALDRDGTRGTEIHATNSEKGPTPCFS